MTEKELKKLQKFLPYAGIQEPTKMTARERQRIDKMMYDIRKGQNQKKDN